MCEDFLSIFCVSRCKQCVLCLFNAGTHAAHMACDEDPAGTEIAFYAELREESDNHHDPDPDLLAAMPALLAMVQRHAGPGRYPRSPPDSSSCERSRNALRSSTKT